MRRETDVTSIFAKHRVGHAAAPFTLPDVEGRAHRLEDYKGHWLLLVFHRHLG